MRAVFKREVNAYFKTMLGYVFMAVFLLISGLGFFLSCMVTGEASMSGVFSLLIDTMIILIPILTMRLLSEEKRNKTDQMLLTAPVSITGIVMGKYLAAVFVFFITSLSTILYPLTYRIVRHAAVFLRAGAGLCGLLAVGCGTDCVGTFYFIRHRTPIDLHDPHRIRFDFCADRYRRAHSGSQQQRGRIRFKVAFRIQPLHYNV